MPMKPLRGRTESRTVTTPLWTRFTGTSGNHSDNIVASQGFSQVTHSYRTRGNDRVITGTNRREILEELSENGYSRKHDTGHPFDTEKRERIFSHPDHYIKGNGLVEFHGALVPNVATGDYTPIPSFDLSSAGTKLIKSAIPTSPINNAAVSLGELILPGGIPKAYTREVLQAELKQMSKASKKKKIISSINRAGDFHLNAAFGYAPIVSDIVKTVNTILGGARYIEQLRRDSGRLVRRSRSLPDVGSYTPPTLIASGVSVRNIAGSGSDGRSTLYQSTSNRTGDVTVETSTLQKVWFRGGFQYYFETPKSYDEGLDRLLTSVDKLTGIALTPERIYQLTPWTWFIDWNSTLGDVITNGQRFSEDGLIMRYGYVMRTTITTRTYTLSGIRFKNQDPFPITVSNRIIRKERFRGDPFGFTTPIPSYNSRQWAILSALSMTGGTGMTLRGR